MVAAAVELAGGPGAVAKLCGVRRQSVYWWINEWKVERLVDALKLSRASGIPIEKLAGAAFDAGTISEKRSTARTRAKSEPKTPGKTTD
jgi:hypothetical protein